MNKRWPDGTRYRRAPCVYGFVTSTCIKTGHYGQNTNKGQASPEAHPHMPFTEADIPLFAGANAVT